MSQIEHVHELLRSSHISRWGIVQTAMRQNIAEHMYRVWTMVAAWGPEIGLSGEEQATAERYALTHDLPEIRTGDAPTPHKTPELKKHLATVEAEILPDLCALEASLTPRAAELVKFCDTAEAVLFLEVNGLGKHALEVKELLHAQMLSRLRGSSAISTDQALRLVAMFHETLSNT